MRAKPRISSVSQGKLYILVSGRATETEWRRHIGPCGSGRILLSFVLGLMYLLYDSYVK